METQKHTLEQKQPYKVIMKNSGLIMSQIGSPIKDEGKDEEIYRTVMSTFQAKEEEIERRTVMVKEKVAAQLGRIQEETKRLADIREELETLQDPVRKEVALLRKRIDLANKDLRPLGLHCQKKEREYKEALEDFNDKSREKAQLVAKLMELIAESEKLRWKKLDDLSKTIDSLK